MHSEALFSAYKRRNRDDVDEEDHIDFDSIVYKSTSSVSDDSCSVDLDEMSVDPHLLEFQSYVSQRPGAVSTQWLIPYNAQIIRYHWSGTPLVLETFNFSAKCAKCGADCVFEFQILPELIKQM